ncbi:hypothetical protein BC937DRAFT_86448, partial [Endogone sp. FLAS-F59071]
SSKATTYLGKIKIASALLLPDSTKLPHGCQIIEGSATQFSKIVVPEDFLVIRGEKRPIKEVLSDTRLIIEGTYPPSITEDYANEYLEFKVERKPNSNEYIDCYSNMYQKYPIESCIQDNGEVSVSSVNSLHVVLGISRQQFVDCDYSQRFSRYITSTFNKLVNTTNKPASLLQHFRTNAELIEDLDVWQLCRASGVRPIGKWLIQCSCLLPIQIAVAIDGRFVPLKDGVITDIDAMLNTEASLATVSKAITFGWYESIFNFYSDRPVKVVTSMGEQSTGKSYFLNHLCGSTFDGSAQRCTEGVWMSMTPTKDTLYVIMDFEGLRSLERTPQEDMLLTLFNAAVSNLILYKNNFAIGRDISTMFHSFQDGATTFDPSNTSSMFIARLAIIIKDVPIQDRKGVVKEFESKFSNIVSKESGNNFITRLYKGQMSILPWPMFNEANFYKTLIKLKKYMDDQEPKSEMARIFLPTIKTIMAKLKVCDWSSLDDSMVRIRAGTIRSLIKKVIAFGAEETEPTIELLKNRDTGAIIIDEPMTFHKILDASEILINDCAIMPDSGLTLLPPQGSLFGEFSGELRSLFERNIPKRSNTTIGTLNDTLKTLDDTQWYNLYNTFIKFVVGRRVQRAKQWFSANTAKFPPDHTEIAAAANDLEQESERLTYSWSLCGITCVKCNLRCLDQRDHSGEHDCYTDHHCAHTCEFIDDHDEIPPCDMPAGHDGTHICIAKNHLCGQQCALYGKRNCQRTCRKQIGHSAEEYHICGSRVHYCGLKCSLSDVKDSKSASQFSCKNTCVIPCEEPHEVHKCENDTACPLPCCLPQCNKRCGSRDHFHAHNAPEEHHMCGDEHQCFKECEADGICEILPQAKAQEEKYNNRYGTFNYTKWVQTSKRLTCCMKIPAGMLTHSGMHVHAPNDAFHFCKIKCPFCEYYCTLPYGHSQFKHDTTHGNMIQTIFAAVDYEFDYEGYRFNVGDRGSAFLCSMYCKSLGRHRHIDYCRKPDDGKCSIGTQHITTKIEPYPDRPKDFVKHSLYWERTAFKDPYSQEDQELYNKCDSYCPDEEHRGEAKYFSEQRINGVANLVVQPKSYCELPIFHPPLNGGSAPPDDGSGYVSADGHWFKCRNPAIINFNFHTIFVIDRSLSMSFRDMRPSENVPISDLLRSGHNNRLGAVYEAIYRFMETRKNTLEKRTMGRSFAASNDTMSLVLFDLKTQIVVEDRDLIGQSELVVEKMIKYSVEGGTNFSVAINEAARICKDHQDESTRIPIIIFLSDGDGTFPEGELRRLFESAPKAGVKPFLFTVLFGNSNGAVLQMMAEFADKYHKDVAIKAGTDHPTIVKPDLKCQYYKALSEVQLSEHFIALAHSLKEHKPALAFVYKPLM